MTNLVLLVGIPGAGKTTWAKTFFDLKYAIVSSDAIRERLAGSLRDAHDKDIRPWDVFYKEIAEKLRHNVDVIADATFLTTKHRRRAYDVAAYADADLHVVIFANVIMAHRRNEARDESTRVPGAVMSNMFDLYCDSLAEIEEESYKYKTVTKIEVFN